MDATVPPQPFIYQDWLLTETEFQTRHPGGAPTDRTQHHKETVFTIGNGYLCTRGSFEEGYPGAWAATFINGVYDDVPVVYTELVNCPDWLATTLLVNGEKFRLDFGEVLNYDRQLDLRRGLLSRLVRWRSPAGHMIDLHFQRFVSKADEHVAALMVELTPLNFQGVIEVQSSINGYPENQGVMHWEWVNQGDIGGENGQPQGVWLHQRTRETHIELGMAIGMQVRGAESPEMELKGCEGYPTLATTFSARSGQTVTLEKVVAVFTSRETQKPAMAAKQHLAQLPDYHALRAAHEEAWAAVWEDCDITIEGDIRAQLAVRYNLFQLLISAPTQDDRVSIPAKSLSGFAYKGHIFWDTEIFILPLFTLTQPQIARNLLSYRYHTLPGSRRKAQASGYPGAAIAWESATTGDEVTPRWILAADPDADPIRIWCGDRELHITTDVAYGVWQYWRATGDDQWMRNYGAEIILDTAIFWGTRVEWNGKREQYEIRSVIGPDEYHDRVDNNTFTNRMVQWHLETALAVWQWLETFHPEKLPELEAKLDLKEDRRHRWADIARRLWVLYDPQTGLVEQCEGFFTLEDINLADYEPRSRSMQAILGIEGANKRQVLKQPDVLMLLYLLRSIGSRGGGQKLNWDEKILAKNWDYYAPRTDHTYGSSLGPAIHGILACDLEQPAAAYEHFMRAAMVDLEDVRLNAADGIHAASAGGVWQATVFGFGGLKLPDGESHPTAKAHLPPGWTRLKYKVKWRGQSYEFDFSAPTEAIPATPMTPGIRGVIFDLDGVLTDTAEFHYQGWQRVADEEGIAFDRKANEAMRGLSRRDSLLQMLGGKVLPEAKMVEIMERKNRYYVELLQHIGPEHLLSGADPLFAELHAAGIKVAIGSASKNARMVIDRLNIAHLVDAIADGNTVDRSKPAPDLFLLAAEQLGLSPVECVVVEDAASGIEAALAAGMLAVGLGPVERVGAAHVILPNLEGVRWADLLEKLTAAR
ncbi:MAG: hypothetical protein Fur0025_08020 [Oscillatoriaceae cyanobacterium]